MGHLEQKTFESLQIKNTVQLNEINESKSTH